MTKHHIVHDIVAKLTTNASFRTFFTLYLMADSNVQRKQIEQSFWKEVEQLAADQQQLMNAEFTRTFLQIPLLLEDLKGRVRYNLKDYA
ncbi:MAG: hypothetical protein AAF806_21210 [Bacteroidota bacterium]